MILRLLSKLQKEKEKKQTGLVIRTETSSMSLPQPAGHRSHPLMTRSLGCWASTAEREREKTDRPRDQGGKPPACHCHSPQATIIILSRHDPQAAEQGLQKEKEKKQISLLTRAANLHHLMEELWRVPLAQGIHGVWLWGWNVLRWVGHSASCWWSPRGHLSAEWSRDHSHVKLHLFILNMARVESGHHHSKPGLWIRHPDLREAKRAAVVMRLLVVVHGRGVTNYSKCNNMWEIRTQGEIGMDSACSNFLPAMLITLNVN
jgi:hypothetical protein